MSGAGFKPLLESASRSGGADDENGGGTISSLIPELIKMSSWTRSEGPYLQPAPRAAVSEAPRLSERILVGGGPHGPEARIQIGDGPLAGIEIRLLAAAGGIEAQLLTPTEGSRQTLISAMDEVKQRLRQKGIALRAGTVSTRGEPSTADHGDRRNPELR
jgi:hypothetical protein